MRKGSRKSPEGFYGKTRRRLISERRSDIKASNERKVMGRAPGRAARASIFAKQKSCRRGNSLAPRKRNEKGLPQKPGGLLRENAPAVDFSVKIGHRSLQ